MSDFAGLKLEMTQIYLYREVSVIQDYFYCYLNFFFLKESQIYREVRNIIQRAFFH